MTSSVYFFIAGLIQDELESLTMDDFKHLGDGAAEALKARLTACEDAQNQLDALYLASHKDLK